MPPLFYMTLKYLKSRSFRKGEGGERERGEGGRGKRRGEGEGKRREGRGEGK